MTAMVMTMASGDWSLQHRPNLNPAEQHKENSIADARQVRDVNLGGTAILGQARCDAQHRVYVRTYTGDLLADSESLQTPVVRLDSASKVTGEFAISDAGPGLLVGDFFVTRDGEVFQLAFDPSNRNVYLAVFAENGSFQRRIRFQAEFAPYQIAVFSNGTFLASGLRYPDRFGKNAHEPYTALFDTSGKLLKEVHLAEDAQLVAEAEKGNSAFVSTSSKDQGNLAVEFGDIATVSNGNAYLMRRTSPALVYEISPLGDLVRTIKIAHEAGWMPVTLKTARNLTVVLFDKERGRGTVLKVIDARGRIVRTRTLHRSIGQALSCYTPPNLVFAGSADKVIRLYRAKAE